MSEVTRSFMRAELDGSYGLQSQRVRSVELADELELGSLFFDAYLGTIDQEEETLEQAVQEVRKTFSGEYGVFNQAASKVLLEDGRPVSAVLVTGFQDRPFVAYAFTSPPYKGKGLAREFLLAAMLELSAQGQSELRLVVTLENEPAVRLYRSLGFQRASAA